MSGWGESNAGWENNDGPTTNGVHEVTAGLEAATINGTQHEAGPADGETETGNPQDHGWTNPTALNYSALAADRDTALQLEAEGIIATWYVHL